MTIAAKPGDAKPVGVPVVPKPAQLGVHNLDRHWRNARTHMLHAPVPPQPSGVEQADVGLFAPVVLVGPAQVGLDRTGGVAAIAAALGGFGRHARPREPLSLAVRPSCSLSPDRAMICIGHCR